MPFSSRLAASRASSSAACSAISALACSGSQGRAEELVDRAQVDRQREHLAAVHRVDPVLVVGELGEAVDVPPHPLVRGVEQVRAVLVDLDPGLRIRRAVGIAADVRPPVDHGDPQAQFVGAPLGDVRPKNPAPTTTRSASRPAPYGERHARQGTDRHRRAVSGPGAGRDRPVRHPDHRGAGGLRSGGLAGPHRHGLAPGSDQGPDRRRRRAAPVAGRTSGAQPALAPRPAADRPRRGGARHHPAGARPAGQRRGDRARRGALDAPGDPQPAGGGLAPGHGGPLDAAGKGDRGPVAGGGRRPGRAVPGQLRGGCTWCRTA